MIKKYAIAICLVLTVTLAACDEANEIKKNDPSKQPNTSSNATSNEDTNSTVTSTPVNSQPEVENNNQNNQTNTDKGLVSAKVGIYEIYDIYNSRGLSTVKSGFSYGVAKDGQPNVTSVNNQKKFDGMKNVKALALDTKSEDKRMYLTFDCGYEYQNLTADILDTLKEKQVKAAFFVTLDYVKKNPTLVKPMIDEGHIVGNHSATHPSFPGISRTKMAEEIWLVEDYLKTNFNYSSKYFRFPAGEHSENSLELVTSMGYTSVFWSVAHADWDTANQPTTQNAVNTVTSRYHGGAVILLHAVSKANTEGLAQMIDIATLQGYQFKTLDEYNN